MAIVNQQYEVSTRGQNPQVRKGESEQVGFSSDRSTGSRPLSHFPAFPPAFFRLGLKALAFIGLLLLLGTPNVRADEAKASEYEFKAAFLYKFANFVGWPSNAVAGETPFVVGVLGEDPFGSALEKTMEGNTVQGRKLVIQRGKELSDLKECQIVFVSATEKKRLPQILETLKGTSVLTVSEIDHFCQSGGMINFKKVGKNLRFEVNPDAAQRANLKISSQLLKLAIIAKEDGKGE
jgi:hypothetical protein